jgi:hypothetical protein
LAIVQNSVLNSLSFERVFRENRRSASSQVVVGTLMQTKELDMLIIHVGMELKLHKTLCHFLVAQLQDLEPNISRKH